MHVIASALLCLIWICRGSRLHITSKRVQRILHDQQHRKSRRGQSVSNSYLTGLSTKLEADGQIEKSNILELLASTLLSLDATLAAWLPSGVRPNPSLRNPPIENRRLQSALLTSCVKSLSVDGAKSLFCSRLAQNGPDMLAVATGIEQPTPKTKGSVSSVDKLLDWATSQGSKLGPVFVAESSFGGGVGMFAARNIQSGEVLFTIPKRLVIDVDKAMADSDCGSYFKQMIGEVDASKVLSAYMAKLRLCADPVFGPYVANGLDHCENVPFWSEEEINLLKGTAAYNQALHVRQDTEDTVAFALGIEPLKRCVKHSFAARGIEYDPQVLNEIIADCVRAAHAFMLSRAFTASNTVPGAQDGSPTIGCRELVPLLDLLQHGEPQIRYKLVQSDVVVTADCDIAAGQEVTLTYGEHPEYIFAAHYGFVPAASSETDLKKGECMLTFTESVMSGSIGASIALAAQMQSADIALLKLVGIDGALGSMSVLSGQFKLASLLADALEWVQYPLTFVISNEMIDLASSDAAGEGNSSNTTGLAVLLACARLCALDAVDMQRFVTDSTDPYPQLEVLLQQLLNADGGRLSQDNDRKAALLLRRAAKEKLLELEAEQPPTESSALSSSSHLEACAALARQVRSSEVLVLQRLAHGDGADKLFAQPFSGGLADPVDVIKSSRPPLAERHSALSREEQFDIVSLRYILDRHLDLMLSCVKSGGNSALPPHAGQMVLEAVQEASSWKAEARTLDELGSKVEELDLKMQEIMKR